MLSIKHTITTNASYAPLPHRQSARLTWTQAALTSFAIAALFAASAGLSACSDDDPTVTPNLPGSENPLLREHRANLSYMTVEDHQIAYLDYGDNDDPAVIMLHGIPTSSFLFRNIAPDIAAAGYRVIAPDLLGFGHSDKPQTAATYSLDDHSRRTFALAGQLGIDSFVLLVHDIGGFVGWNMLAEHPQRLDALITTDTTPTIEGTSPNELTLMHFAPDATLTPRDVWSQLDQLEWAEMAARSFLTQGLSNPNIATDVLVQAYGLPLATGSSEAFIQFFETLPPELSPAAESERSAMFQAFGKPAAIIFGTDDHFFDNTVIVPKLAQDLAVPEHHITIVNDAGHYIQEEKPTAYVNAIIAFLQAL